MKVVHHVDMFPVKEQVLCKMDNNYVGIVQTTKGRVYHGKEAPICLAMLCPCNSQLPSSAIDCSSTIERGPYSWSCDIQEAAPPLVVVLHPLPVDVVLVLLQLRLHSTTSSTALQTAVVVVVVVLRTVPRR
mgnify:CR=1 FL=1